jgi:zinc transporter
MLLTKDIPGFVCAFRFGKGAPQALDGTTSFGPPDHPGEWLWLHLNLTDQRCQRWLQDTLRLPAKPVADFCQPATRQTLSSTDGTLVGILSDFHREFDSDSTAHAWLHVLCTAKVIVTGRVKAVQSAERMRQAIAHGHNFPDPLTLCGAMLGNYPDTLDAVLHRLLSELELIEDHVLEERHRGERKRLMVMRRETAQLHRHMRALRRALTLADRTLDGLPPQLPTIINRLTNLDQDFESMERRARFFHDEIDAKLAAETNRQLYILSALTALFLPPTLVAGLFGMNVKGIPWSDAANGFWPAVALCALSSVAVSLFLWNANKG